MKAATVQSTGIVSVLDVEKPTPSKGEVLVKVKYTGVCGSDVPRVLEGRVHRFPIVLGHEFSGVVERVGENVDASLVGKRVAGVPLVPCGDCKCCLDGDYSLCEQYSFIGSRQAGSMAEYVCVPSSCVFPVSNDVSDIEAAFFEPATVALHAVNLTSFASGCTALVYGSGTIGILLAQSLVALGARSVVLCNRSQSRLNNAARAEGVTLVCTAESGWKETALDVCPEGFQHVFDTVACSSSIADCFELAARKAQVCFIGTPKKEVVLGVSSWEQVNRKELTVLGSWMSYSSPWPGEEWTLASDLFASGSLRVFEEMIDAMYPLSETQMAFDGFAEGSVSGKILIDSQE